MLEGAVCVQQSDSQDENQNDYRQRGPVPDAQRALALLFHAQILGL